MLSDKTIRKMAASLSTDDNGRQLMAVSLFAALQMTGKLLDSHGALDWLLHTSDVDSRPLLEETMNAWRSGGFNDSQELPVIDCPSVAQNHLTPLVERLLAAASNRQRKRRGVYYTPAPLARLIVEAVDEVSPLIEDERNILDPAAGSGVFLAEAIRLVRSKHFGGIGDRVWSNRASTELLPRLFGCELMPAAAMFARFNLALALLETGFEFGAGGPLNIIVGDALKQRSRLSRVPFQVIIGNPPWAALNQSNRAWIDDLLRGKLDGNSYMHVDGEPLGERKLWLHDDYVKFIRWAQYKIDQAGGGVLGFVANHAFLDNLTFRGMRNSLLESFPAMTILDLHGNRKNRERPPKGRANENLFGIDQGTTVGLFVSENGSREPGVRFGELWGTAAEKIAAIKSHNLSELAARSLSPTAPHYFLAPRGLSATSAGGIDSEAVKRWAEGIPLDVAMPAGSTVPVTARDRFVIAFTREELCERLEQFRDLSISDDEIRARFFTRTRSSRYPPGDSRGWKLSQARRKLAQDDAWQTHIRKCAYRPFDQRYIYFSPDMVDWPRLPLSSEMLAGDNLALIARRQIPPSDEACYFFVTDALPIDGLIRSDNRGSESFFPMRVAGAGNFSPETIAMIECRTGLSWVDQERGNDERSFGRRRLFTYIYATFHQPAYRRQFAALMQSEFPRVLPPANKAEFNRLADTGQTLIELHTLQTKLAKDARRFAADIAAPQATVGARFPVWKDGQVLIQPAGEPSSAVAVNISDNLWQHRTGAHQVLKKWLAVRRGRQLSDAEIAKYQRIAAAIEQTQQIVETLDR